MDVGNARYGRQQLHLPKHVWKECCLANSSSLFSERSTRSGSWSGVLRFKSKSGEEEDGLGHDAAALFLAIFSQYILYRIQQLPAESDWGSVWLAAVI